MKNIFFLILSTTFLFSCRKERNFTLKICSGHDFTYNESWIKCDSFQMINQNEAFIWVDATKMKVIGDRGIRPESN